MARVIFYALNSFVLVAVLSSLLFWIHRLVKHFWSGGQIAALVPLSPREKPRWTLGEFFLMFGLSIVAIVVLQTTAVSLGWLEQPEIAVDAAVPSPASPTVDTGLEAADTGLKAIDTGLEAADNGLKAVNTGLEAADNGLKAVDVASKPAPEQNLLPMLAINTVAGLIALGLTLIWLKLVAGCSRANLGLCVSRNDIALGFKAAWWFIPPVLLLSVLASLLVPYEHPVLETLANTAVPGTWVMLFISTAVIVPFVEEFMFRVMLQGGLQRMAEPHTQSPETDDSDQQSVHVTSAKDPGSENWLADAYLPPPQTTFAVDKKSDVASNWQPKAFWPIVVTSLLFALMHVGQGAAYIPLFFLSLGLGYLYRQTGRITAPVIVHMVLNGLTMIVEFSRIAAGIEAGGF